MSSIVTTRRSATDSKLAGLSGGLGRQWGVDPVLVRVGFVLLALSAGIGVVLYLAGWMLIPVEGKDEAPIDDILGEQARRWGREVWIVIVAVCCVLSVAVLGGQTAFGFGPDVVLALMWYFGYYRHRTPGSRSAEPRTPQPPLLPHPDLTQQFSTYSGPPTPFTQAATAWQQRIMEAQHAQRQHDQVVTGEPRADHLGGYAPVGSSAEDTREPDGPASFLPPAQPFGQESRDYNAFLATPDPVGLYSQPGPGTAALAPTPPRRSASRSALLLRLVALLAVGLTLSGLAAADALGAHQPVAVYLAATLLVLGLTLVAATWFGRARGILPVALLVLVGTIGSTIVGPVAHNQGWGTEQVSYSTVSQLTGDRHQLGQLKVDLSRLTTTTDAAYTAHVGIGDLEVTAPRSVNVVINWKVQAGALIVDGNEVQSGSGLSGTIGPVSRDPKKKTLTLNLSVDGGAVRVTR